jgi:hypothetical protein
MDPTKTGDFESKLRVLQEKIPHFGPETLSVKCFETFDLKTLHKTMVGSFVKTSVHGLSCPGCFSRRQDPNGRDGSISRIDVFLRCELELILCSGAQNLFQICQSLTPDPIAS